jgi:hypothetical protein
MAQPLLWAFSEDKRGTDAQNNRNSRERQRSKAPLGRHDNVESFAEIDRTCAHYRSESNHTVVLDMAGVTFMQTEPAQKLAQLKRDRLRIINCSPFIAALLETAETTD